MRTVTGLVGTKKRCDVRDILAILLDFGILSKEHDIWMRAKIDKRIQ